MSITLADILDAVPESGLSLEELTAIASESLVDLGIASEDGRTSTAIDTRTVRFYQTLGILPKPVYEGRRAVYALSHLIRVIAAKQLQAEGLSLAQIQTTLPQQTDDALVQALSIARRPSPQSTNTNQPIEEVIRCEAPSAVHANSAQRQTAVVAELRSFTLKPGVTLLIDPSVIQDPAEFASALSSLVRSSLTTTDRSGQGRERPSTPRTH